MTSSLVKVGVPSTGPTCPGQDGLHMALSEETPTSQVWSELAVVRQEDPVPFPLSLDQRETREDDCTRSQGPKDFSSPSCSVPRVQWRVRQT